MERMTNDALRERLVRESQAAFPKLLAGCHHTVASRYLEALGLDDETMAMLADWRYSNEFVGNVLRSKLLATDAKASPDE